jgi:hypothetical protein
VGTVELALTGPAGGSWRVRVGGADGPRPDEAQAEVILDILEFCLLVAGRRAPEAVGAVVAGDETLGHALLALAPSLSGP